MNWKYYDFDIVDSTNNLATNYPPGTVITAKIQTAGRGRYGRQWISREGNLFLSLVLKDEETQTPFLPFAAAVSVAETLVNCGYNVKIKWPNDILFNQGKAAGILLERTEKGTVIIGIGINLSSAPQENVLYQTSALETTLTPKELTVAICDYITYYTKLLKAEGFEKIRLKWLEYAYGIGEKIHVRLPNETITGIFEELTPQGAISLKQGNGTVRFITVGDIFFEKDKNDDKNTR